MYAVGAGGQFVQSRLATREDEQNSQFCFPGWNATGQANPADAPHSERCFPDWDPM